MVYIHHIKKSVNKNFYYFHNIFYELSRKGNKQDIINSYAVKLRMLKSKYIKVIPKIK
jgi:hypothetical protein